MEMCKWKAWFTASCIIALCQITSPPIVNAFFIHIQTRNSLLQWLSINHLLKMIDCAMWQEYSFTCFCFYCIFLFHNVGLFIWGCRQSEDEFLNILVAIAMFHLFVHALCSLCKTIFNLWQLLLENFILTFLCCFRLLHYEETCVECCEQRCTNTTHFC